MTDKTKKLFVEFLQATAFAGVLGFLFILISGNPELYRGKRIIQVSMIGFIFGGIPMMLAKRFMLAAIKSARE